MTGIDPFMLLAWIVVGVSLFIMIGVVELLLLVAFAAIRHRRNRARRDPFRRGPK